MVIKMQWQDFEETIKNKLICSGIEAASRLPSGVYHFFNTENSKCGIVNGDEYFEGVNCINEMIISVMPALNLSKAQKSELLESLSPIINTAIQEGVLFPLFNSIPYVYKDELSCIKQ